MRMIELVCFILFLPTFAIAQEMNASGVRNHIKTMPGIYCYAPYEFKLNPERFALIPTDDISGVAFLEGEDYVAVNGKYFSKKSKLSKEEILRVINESDNSDYLCFFEAKASLKYEVKSIEFVIPIKYLKVDNNFNITNFPEVMSEVLYVKKIQGQGFSLNKVGFIGEWKYSSGRLNLYLKDDSEDKKYKRDQLIGLLRIY